MSAPLNEPAFPSVCLGDPGHPSSVPGMTLRDWFAGQALAASGLDAGHRHGWSHEEMADQALEAARVFYAVADAMLAERGKASSPAPAQPAWIERKVRKNTEEHRAYLSARFPRGAGSPSPFDFDGHKWSYHYTSFDDLGEFDVLHRPNPDAAA